MPTTQQLRTRLIDKLKELFQLDQPDLDFGFYRIMHAKAGQVIDFLENDLLQIVADTFGQLEAHDNQDRMAQAREKVLQTLGNTALSSDGHLAEKFRDTPAGQTYLTEVAAIAQAKDALSAEAEVYDHLYRFFERYYDDGDFISRRYYARETAGRAAPFAVPYHGEEVKLHWANADQYYIKTAEYFTNFTFDLRQASEVQMPHGTLDLDISEEPLRAHFRIVAATEGEHGNVKASEADKRFFILHGEQPIALNEDGELVIQFEYRPDPEKSGKDATWRARRNDEAVETVLARLETMAGSTPRLGEYLRLLRMAAPTDKDKNRPLLAKYINQYTARNSMDYFIHKDLGGFLHRELDFYIKNEVMRLDDIEHADTPSVERYLDKLRVLRRIAGRLIDFLAQLEAFQKKLWLKKKFVVETHYGITLDRIPEALYPDIAANDAQREAWVQLFAIDEIEASTTGPGYCAPLTVDFLKANNTLVLDTRFFDETFTARLVASIEGFDDQCDGLLIHSENFQALSLLKESYFGQTDCIYIDPPYNTGGDGFIYKDSYQHSSWLSMFRERIDAIVPIASKSAVFFSSVDDNEMSNMRSCLDSSIGNASFESQIIIQSNKRGQTYQSIAKTHEYLMVYSIGDNAEIYELPKETLDNALSDENGAYELWELRNRNPKFGRHNRPNLFYPIYVAVNEVNDEGYSPVSLTNDVRFIYEVLPRNSAGDDSCWRWGTDKVRLAISGHGFDKLVAKQRRDGGWNIYEKARKGTTKAKSIWYETGVINEQGTVEVGNLGFSNFGFPKPTELIRKIIQIGCPKNGIVIDYFAGSGTTGHAVINLNRDDDGDGERKYILVEMGDYFDTVLKPRIAKVVYAPDWKDGKPVSRDKGISHCFKYLRLESYEDTLNNLRMEAHPTRDRALAANPGLKEDYMLHYLLDVETRGSPSLLNIDAFANPTAYTLRVKKPGTDAYITRTVDLVETFHYLLGLRVMHLAAPQRFHASFVRHPDPELPEDQHTRLMVDGEIQEDHQGSWWFRAVEGWVPADPVNPDNGQREKVLIIWRILTDDPEQDNVVLDAWFRRYRNRRDGFAFDTVYVNGSNTLPGLRGKGESWKVRLIEEAFMTRMWDVEGI